MSSYASLQLILNAHNNYAPSTSVLATWGTAKPFSTTDLVATRVGLFGADLTSFMADCTASGTTVCTTSIFNSYTGWAVGVVFQPSPTTPPTAGYINGLALNGLRQYVEVMW